MFSRCSVEGHEDFVEQDREDDKKMETIEQRKRLATAGDLCWGYASPRVCPRSAPGAQCPTPTLFPFLESFLIPHFSTFENL
jgi:hypothetical protein